MCKGKALEKEETTCAFGNRLPLQLVQEKPLGKEETTCAFGKRPPFQLAQKRPMGKEGVTHTFCKRFPSYFIQGEATRKRRHHFVLSAGDLHPRKADLPFPRSPIVNSPLSIVHCPPCLARVTGTASGGSGGKARFFFSSLPKVTSEHRSEARHLV